MSAKTQLWDDLFAPLLLTGFVATLALSPYWLLRLAIWWSGF